MLMLLQVNNAIKPTTIDIIHKGINFNTLVCNNINKITTNAMLIISIILIAPEVKAKKAIKVTKQIYIVPNLFLSFVH